MSREIIRTDQAPKAPSYSQAVKAGGLVFVAGQGPFDPVTGEVVGETIQEQTRQCLRNVEAILAAAGSSFLDTWGSYAEVAGYAPTDVLMPRVVLDRDGSSELTLK